MENLKEMEKQAGKKGVDEIKYGNPGIRTNVWSTMGAMYGQAIGTLIGLNMDLLIQFLNQGLINPMQKYKNQMQDPLMQAPQEVEQKETELHNFEFKQVKIE